MCVEIKNTSTNLAFKTSKIMQNSIFKEAPLKGKFLKN
jgi:hypothetical protein